MSFGFHPISKAEQVRKVPVKQRKQHNKPEIHKGRLIPKRSVRGRILKKDYNEALRRHGDYCYLCGTTVGLEAHHVRFRSNGGRGGWRNIRFLCNEHHRGKYSPHQDEGVRRALEVIHEEMYGEWFWADRYDLFMAGLIPNTTEKAFEAFMQEEERKAQYRQIDVDCSANAYF